MSRGWGSTFFLLGTLESCTLQCEASSSMTCSLWWLGLVKSEDSLQTVSPLGLRISTSLWRRKPSSLPFQNCSFRAFSRNSWPLDALAKSLYGNLFFRNAKGTFTVGKKPGKAIPYKSLKVKRKLKWTEVNQKINNSLLNSKSWWFGVECSQKEFGELKWKNF